MDSWGIRIIMENLLRTNACTCQDGKDIGCGAAGGASQVCEKAENQVRVPNKKNTHPMQNLVK